MKPSIVLFSASDIAAARHIATMHEDADVLVFDPTLVDRASDAGLARVEYLQWDGAPTYRQACDEALRQASALGRDIDLAARHPRCTGLALGTWQHLTLYYLHLALNWYFGLFEALAPQLMGRRLLVPMLDTPQVYYFPSFVPALLLLLQAQRAGADFTAYTYGSKEPAPHVVPDLRGQRPAEAGGFLLTHLPTCFYDTAYIAAEIKASGRPVVDLCAQYWNVPLAAETTIPLVAERAVLGELGAAELEYVQTTAQDLVAPIDRHLSRWITAPAYRSRQVAELVATYRAQMITELMLEQHFARAVPARLLLSDHDTDFHGPLAAFARRHQVPMVVLPHSKASTDMDFVTANATVLYHAIQGDTVYDVDGHRPAQFKIDMPVAFEFTSQAPAPVRRIGLLLNGVALNGVPSVDFEAYGQGLRRIVQWCAEQNLALIVRSRPGQSLFKPLLAQSGLTPDQMAESVQGTMEEFARRCDLCLMYDAPTTGVLELLSRGIPTLNPVVTSLIKRDTAIIHSSVVPRADVEATLRHAAQLVADAVELRSFRKQQFLSFVGLYRDTQSLHAFL